MKKIVIILTVVSLAIFAIQGVSLFDYNPDVILSCDPVIDKKVKAQLVTLRKMSRTEIGKENREFQRTFYRSLKPEEKLKMWNDKFEKVFEYSWEKEKLAHIKSFASKINLNLFMEEEAEVEEFLEFTNQWVKESFDRFGWSMDNLYYLIVNPFEDGKKSKLFLTSYVLPCECSTSFDYCGSSTVCEHLTGSNCQYTKHGCGPLWMSNCDGKCINL